jgi:SAM-dependent methyltransferase
MNCLQGVLFSLSERYYELRFGVETRGQLFHSNPENIEYTPLPYRHLFAGLRRLQRRPGDVFLDYGCGKGRALIVAAGLRFDEVIGVELSPELSQVARDNTCHARGVNCGKITVVCTDAAEFDLPDSVTVLFFFNPFTGSVLRRVLVKIRQSLDRRPREILVVFFNRAAFAKETAGLTWVETLQEFSLECPRVGCGIYRLGQRTERHAERAF